MRQPIHLKFLAAVCLLCSPLALVLAQGQITRLPLTEELLKDQTSTDWYGVYLNEKKIGYAKSNMELVKTDGDSFYRQGFYWKAKLKADGKSIELDIVEELDFDAKAPYALRGGKMTQKQNDVKQVVTLKRSPAGFVKTTEVKGQADSQQIGKIDYTLGDHMTPSSWVRQKPKVGDKISALVFEFDKDKTETRHYKVLSIRDSRVKGVAMTYYEIEENAPIQKIKTIQRFDSKGSMLSAFVANVFEFRLETEEQAKNLDLETDLFVMGLVKIDKGLGDPNKVKGLVVELVGKQADSIESGPWQTVSKTADGKLICKVGKAHGKKIKATEKEIQDSLESTVAYPAKNPKIVELAKKAVGDAQTPQDKVKNLVKFVHNYITPSFGGKGMVVLDLLHTKQGDCTAYAALFTTLARAAGIPTREVTGFAYMGDGQKSFGGHAWNEVVLDGHWHPIDATYDEFEIDAARFSIGSDQQGTATLLKNLGNLSLRLIEVQHK